MTTRTTHSFPFSLTGKVLENSLKSITAFDAIEGMDKASKIIIQASYHHLARLRFIRQYKREDIRQDVERFVSLWYFGFEDSLAHYLICRDNRIFPESPPHADPLMN